MSGRICPECGHELSFNGYYGRMACINCGLVVMTELPYGACSSLKDAFGADMIKQLRADFKDNCLGLAEVIRGSLMRQGYIAEIITFKNGNAFLDGGIRVGSGRIYTHHTVVLMGEWVIDLLHSDNVIKTKNYINRLKKHNPKLRIDYTLSTGWYADDGYMYRPSIDDLINYKYKEH